MLVYRFVCFIDQFVRYQLTKIYENFEKSRFVLKHEHDTSCVILLLGFVVL